MDPLASLTNFATQHPRLLVLTGAGCSTEAGIPDYRDANGAWKRNEPMRFQLFVGDALARKRYWARSMLGWRTMAAARPTTAHRALAQLERAGRIQMLVTQNVDGLHNAAGSDAMLVAGSSLMVYSGYRFVEEAVAAGKPVAAVNIGRTRADAMLTLKVEHEVGAALVALALL